MWVLSWYALDLFSLCYCHIAPGVDVAPGESTFESSPNGTCMKSRPRTKRGSRLGFAQYAFESMMGVVTTCDGGGGCHYRPRLRPPPDTRRGSSMYLLIRVHSRI